MSAVDGAVVAVYLTGLLLAGLRWSRTAGDEVTHYLGGRALPWWALAASMTATQTSTTSFLGIPAFVALQPHGGLTWLQYEVALPLAMVVVAAVLVPAVRGPGFISIHEYLAWRFDPSTRRLLSLVFLISRGLATGVALYAAGLVVQTCTGLPTPVSILVMAVITVAYDAAGGMRAVVWTDVGQMALLLAGVGVCLWQATHLAGGWTASVDALDAGRLRAIDWTHGLGDGASAPFWGFLAGGVVLYVAYYGVDQTQAQRQLSARSVAEAQRVVLVSGLLRMPLTALYAALGVALAAVVSADPVMQAAVRGTGTDTLVLHFITTHLPDGLRGLVVSALLAAAMSSLDSALNSLSASTVRDFDLRDAGASGGGTARRVTLAWGVAVTAVALVTRQVSGSLVETINRIGVVFYGPLLAAFLTGIASTRVSGRGIRWGVVAGVAVNVALLACAGGRIFWMWLTVSGLLVAVAVAAAVGVRRGPPPVRRLSSAAPGLSSARLVGRAVGMMVYTAAIVAALAAIGRAS